MNVKRFFAPTAREALRLVKEELGGDAIVLSNRSLDDGVEIMAAPAAALAALTPEPVAPAAPARALSARPGPGEAAADADFHVSLSSRMSRDEAPQVRPWQPLEARRVLRENAPRSEAPRREAPKAATRREDPPRPASAPAAPAPASPALMDELQSIRGLIEKQLAGFAWGQLARQAPAKSALLGELLEAGFSGELARRLVDLLPEDAPPAAVCSQVRTLLNRGLVTAGSDADIIDQGGVFALVGPTGVGKTTTTAKLAARCVVRHGAERLALLTTDSYRIGAHEQLRIYGRILGVSVHAVRDGADLRQTLDELRGKHMVLIDTVGMSQRDRAVAEQAAMLTHAGDVKRLLLVNATSRGDTLDDVVRAYAGPDLAGCILTKVDEAAALAPALDVLIRHELALYYVANGQRVPEDLHLPNRSYLLHRALKTAAEDSAHRLDADEAALLMAASGALAPRQASFGGRLG